MVNTQRKGIALDPPTDVREGERREGGGEGLIGLTGRYVYSAWNCPCVINSLKRHEHVCIHIKRRLRAIQVYTDMDIVYF